MEVVESREMRVKRRGEEKEELTVIHSRCNIAQMNTALNLASCAMQYTHEA
jgi:hypothetical protein